MTLASGSMQQDLVFDFGGFQNLMPNRIHNVLLVSSLYESFILEEDGLIAEMITSEFVDMKLSHAPRVARVSSGEQALQFLEHNPIDLMITMTRLGNLNAYELAASAKRIRPDLPIVVLADNPRELLRQEGARPLVRLLGGPHDQVVEILMIGVHDDAPE